MNFGYFGFTVSQLFTFAAQVTVKNQKGICSPESQRWRGSELLKFTVSQEFTVSQGFNVLGCHCTENLLCTVVAYCSAGWPALQFCQPSGLTVHVVPVCARASYALGARVNVYRGVHVDTRGGTVERRALQ